jgi:hypothetical protein
MADTRWVAVTVEEQAWAVWNRACSSEPGAAVGDRHLHALLRVHGVTMNGGTGRLVDIRSAVEFEQAACACEYVGLPNVAALLREIIAEPITPEREHRLNEQYFMQARDDRLFEAFFRKFESTPEGLQQGDLTRTTGRAPCHGPSTLRPRAVAITSCGRRRRQG